MGNMLVEINGGIRLKQGKLILIVYSSAFARFLIEHKIDRLNLFFEKDYLRIFPGTDKKVTIERKSTSPLCTMAITRLAPLTLIKELELMGRQKQVIIRIENLISQEDMENYNNRINHLEPTFNFVKNDKNNLLKVGCNIAHTKYKRSYYRFNIRNRIFEKIVKDKYKVGLCREGNEFYIFPDPQGIELKIW